MTHIAADEKPDRRILMRAWLTQLRIWWCKRESLIASDVVYITVKEPEESIATCKWYHGTNLKVTDVFEEIKFGEAANMLLEGDMVVMTSGGHDPLEGFWFEIAHGVALHTDDTDVDKFGVYTTPRRSGYDLPTEWLDYRRIEYFHFDQDQSDS